MDPSAIDGEPLQAVKSLRSKFEQFAVTDPSRRSSTNPNGVDVPLQLPGAVNPRSRQSSGSQVNLSVPQEETGMSSSSDLKVVIKRLPPPPPPPRTTRPPQSPLPSRSPSPLRSARDDIGNAHKREQEVLQGNSDLKLKL